MQEKLDAIITKLDAISVKLEGLENRLDELENTNYSHYHDMLTETQTISFLVDTVCEYLHLDFPKLEKENLIFVHTNAFRTASFVNTLMEHYKRGGNMNKVTAENLTPAFLLKHLEENDIIILTSDVFSYAPEFEGIIADAIEREATRFAILTNDIESIPQALREKMRVIQ